MTDTDRIRAQRYSVYDESGDQYDATDEVHALVARLEAAEAALSPTPGCKCETCREIRRRFHPLVARARSKSDRLNLERSQETGQP